MGRQEIKERENMSGKDGVKRQASKEAKALLVNMGEAASKLEEKEDDEQKEASLGDLMGLMGGLMAAFAPPEQGKEIEKQFQELGKTMGPMLEVLAKGAGALDTPAYHWAEMNSDVLPENALAAGLDRTFDNETRKWCPSTDPNVYVARAEIDGKFYSGKVHTHQLTGKNTRYCFKPAIAEKEVTTEPFSVLCVDPKAELEWVKYDWKNAIPNMFGDDGVPKGIVTAGKNCYVGRGFVLGDKDKLQPGLIHTEERSAKGVYQVNLLYGNMCRRERNFEYLVIKDKETDVKDVPAE